MKTPKKRYFTFMAKMCLIVVLTVFSLSSNVRASTSAFTQPVANGAIARGDYLTISSTQPGVAVLATSSSATIIGIALEPTTTDGKISVFMRSSLGDFSETGASSSSFETISSSYSLSDLIAAAFSSVDQWVGNRIVAAEGYFGNLTVGSAAKPIGITLYDKVTGAPYCLQVANGAPVTVAGECGTQTTASTTPSTTPTTKTTNASTPPSSNTNSSNTSTTPTTATTTTPTTLATSTSEIIATTTVSTNGSRGSATTTSSSLSSLTATPISTPIASTTAVTTPETTTASTTNTTSSPTPTPTPATTSVSTPAPTTSTPPSTTSTASASTTTAS